MPRPQKCRRVCSAPKSCIFMSDNKMGGDVVLQVDEYETIRLLDYEGMTQEQTAVQMNVARATVTLIYENARKKIADALVNGKSIIIQGGNVKVCDAADNCCGRCGTANCMECNNRQCKRKDEEQ